MTCAAKPKPPTACPRDDETDTRSPHVRLRISRGSRRTRTRRCSRAGKGRPVEHELVTDRVIIVTDTRLLGPTVFGSSAIFMFGCLPTLRDGHGLLAFLITHPPPVRPIVNFTNFKSNTRIICKLKVFFISRFVIEMYPNYRRKKIDVQNQLYMILS